MDRTAWIRTEVLPSLLGKDGLGSDTITSCDVIAQGETKDHFTSSVFFVTIEVNNNGKSKRLDVIVKLEPTDEFHRTMINTQGQFANEVIMYMEVFPLLREYIRTSPDRFSFSLDDLFPKCYHAYAGSKGDSLVVLENLKPKGYSVNDGVFLDYEKAISAFRQIGRYHGLCYAYKKQNQDKFISTIGKLCDPRPTQQIQFLTNTSFRGLEYLKPRVKGEVLEAVCRIEEQFGNILTLMFDLIKPKEPLAVLCHGDFNRNNLFFRNNSGSCDVQMFDLQLARYASPAIDTGFITYMNLSPEVRKEHWDVLFQCYHNTVVETLSRALEVTSADLGPEFSLQSFKQDFADHSLHAYIICAFFLPMMLTPAELEVNMENIASQPMEDIAKEMAKLGGESMTKMLGEMLEEIIGLRLATVQKQK